MKSTLTVEPLTLLHSKDSLDCKYQTKEKMKTLQLTTTAVNAFSTGSSFSADKNLCLQTCRLVFDTAKAALGTHLFSLINGWAAKATYTYGGWFGLNMSRLNTLPSKMDQKT